jgi:acyl carrier protein
MQPDMEDRIRQIMADILNVAPEDMDGSTGMDNVSSWDSLHHLNLCLALEQEFGITLEVNEIESMLTYAVILQVMQRKIAH